MQSSQTFDPRRLPRLWLRGADETTVRYPSAASTPYDRANACCSLVRRWAIRGATIPAREIVPTSCTYRMISTWASCGRGSKREQRELGVQRRSASLSKERITDHECKEEAEAER